MSKAIRSSLPAVAVALSLATAAHAAGDGAASLADLSIEQLMEVRVASVYGASKHEQKVTQAPSSVSILTSEDIRRSGYRTLADALRGIPGLYVSDDRNYPYLGIRGFLRPGDYNTRVLVTIDGHRMNDNVYDGALIGREGMIDVELIERVEVIRGPSSSLYGSSAFFGVINVITKRGEQVDGAELSGEVGTFDTRRGRFTYGEKYASGLEWLVSGSHYESGGVRRLYYPEFDQRLSAQPRAANDGVAVGMDGEDARQMFTKLRYRGASLAAYFSDRNKDIPTASFESAFADPREQTRDRRAYVELGFEHRFGETLSLQTRVFYDDYLYRGIYPYEYAADGSVPAVVAYRDAGIGQWAGTEWQLTARPLPGHTVLLGGEYRDHWREYQEAYYDVEPRLYDVQADRSSSMLGLYAQDEIRLREDLVLTAGLRFDRYSENFGSTFNPRLGLIYNASPTATVKALYGQAFRAPNPFEHDYNPEQRNRPELQPEEIRTYELAYEQYVGRRYRLGVAAYYYDVDELITQAATEAGAQYFDNLADVRAAGIELEAESKFESGIQLGASYTLQRAKDEDGAEELSSSPRHLGKLRVTAPIYGNLLGSLELQYNASSRTIRGARSDDFLLAHLTLLTNEPMRGLGIAVGVYNLFDTRYGYPGSADHRQDVIEQDSRSVQGKLTYKF